MKFVELISSRWGTITATAVPLAAVFGIVLTYTVNLKNEQISTIKEKNDFLETRIKDLSEHGPFPQTVRKIDETIKDIQKKLIPLTVLVKFDPLIGKVNLGASKGLMHSYPTNLSHKVTDAMEYVNQKKYDLASKLSDEIEKEFPGFLGVDFIRFAVNEKKDDAYSKETVKYAERLVKGISINETPTYNYENMKKVYFWLINYYLREAKKKDAEDIALQAIENWPDDQSFKSSFEKVFGYKPTLN